MKKIFLMLGVAAAAIGMSSCSNNSANKTAETLGDSIAVNVGQLQGSQMANDLNSMTPDQLKQQGLEKFNKEAFLKGLRAVLDADTVQDGYLIGISQGLQMMGMVQSLHEAGIEVDKDLFFENYKKAFTSDSVSQESLLTLQEENQTLMTAARNAVMEHQRAEQERAVAEAKAAADNYMAEQKKADPSIQTTESGLSYKVVKQGEGTPATEGKVKVIYTGKLVDGTEFDSSKGEPVEFDINQVVPGFSEGLKMMAPGSKYVLYVPDSLGYNGRGPGGPGAMMVFDVEVVAE